MFFILIFTSISMFAEPTNRLKERIKTLKKVKLIEILDLSEDKSEKFMIKYNTYQSKIDSKNMEVDNAIQELETVASNKNSKIEIIKLKTNLLQRVQNELVFIIQEKDKEIKSILNEVEFAKYLVFERKFANELRKSLLRLNKKRFE
ncbi:MAG: hypothetical protein NTW25_11895 [Candidatus Kapabacteria bacterium]|nr:hypothetical protein [Candidatus Kapabacteria bacterium]